MLASLRTYRLPAALVAVVMAFGVLLPLVQHACTWVGMSDMMTSLELPCHEEAEHTPAHPEPVMPCHDSSVYGSQLAPSGPAQPGCCLLTTEQPTDEGVRVTAPVFEYALALALVQSGIAQDEESQIIRLAPDHSGPPGIIQPLHILHRTLLI